MIHVRSWPVVTLVLVVLLSAGAAVFIYSSPDERSSEPASRHSRHIERSSPAVLPTLPSAAQSHHPGAGVPAPQHRAIPLPPVEARAAVRWFEDSRRPLTQRAAAIDALARDGDADALKRLQALSDARVYLSFKAVEALGAFHAPSPPIGYLAGKLADDDPRVAQAAITALERRYGAGAVAPIAAAIRRNRRRADGLGEQINAVAVRTLGAIAAPAAAPVLIAELTRVQGEGTNLEYGSQIVVALGKINTPSARGAINAYAAWLSSDIPDDPLARRYHLDKIAEARRAVAAVNSW